MGIITPTNTEVTTFTGLHLYHNAVSNCSQRVRLALAEKSLDFTSHHLDLSKDEHVTDAYLSINPNGVVPTLVDNGVVVIESNDILAYLDEHYPTPQLQPSDAADQDAMREWLERSAAFQRTIKTMSMYFLFLPFVRKSVAQISQMEAVKCDPDTIAFYRELSSPEGLSQARIQEAVQHACASVAQLEAHLQTHEWLAGSEFSLADISWFVNVYRLQILRFPSSAYPSVGLWKTRIMHRPSFATAIRKWEPALLRYFAPFYTYYRHVQGTGISDAITS